MTYTKDPRVDDYIKRPPAWHQDICQRGRGDPANRRDVPRAPCGSEGDVVVQSAISQRFFGRGPSSRPDGRRIR